MRLSLDTFSSSVKLRKEQDMENAVGLKIYWSDSLEELARLMFSNTEARKDPFETECTVVGSPVMAGWLKQYFLYDFPKKKDSQKVLACWDFQMLHPFVNDWLAKACTGTPVGQRDPAQHPYSPGALQWRIWNELLKHDEENYSILHAYTGDVKETGNIRRWSLATRLAQLFDDYQNYRPELLNDWLKAPAKGLDDNNRWQGVMWRSLVKDEPETYLKQFEELPEKLTGCGIKDVYRRISVFHISAMPKAYMHFFVELGKIMDVQMFTFNPSKEFWIDDPTVKKQIIELSKNADKPEWMNPPHLLLNGFGRCTQALLATMLDESEGNINDEYWAEDKEATLLQKVQKDIRNKDKHGIDNAEDDGSIQLHSCHGPLREVEVAKDLILKWFEENPGSQPRDVQVLVPDMDVYAPFIESVFRVSDHNPEIPCSISKRPAVSAGTVGSAFVRLMKFNASRMTAPEVVELLELEPVRERYQLSADELPEIRGLVNSAGIRWGRDAAHVKEALGGEECGIPDTVTWRRGLDRLAAGFAIGRCAEGDDMIEAGELGSLRVYDGVEGKTAVLAGRLGQFFDDLAWVAENIGRKPEQPVSQWADFLEAVLERFFRSTENSFRDLAEIRRGITSTRKAAAVAGDPRTTADVMAAAIEAQLGGMEPAGRSDTNEVLFSPLRTMQVTPRKLVILLGLNEGVFPRADKRPAFDLLATKPFFGDRSLRHEDRLSFLEAIMSARERLIITYTGRNITNNRDVPPSPAVTECRQYLDKFSNYKDGEGKRAPLIKTVDHKLHGFNPEYYKKSGELFSYSVSNFEAAKTLAGGRKNEEEINPLQGAGGMLGAVPLEAHGKTDITLEELQKFFINPANYFYQNVLKIRLPDPASDDVSDSEMFDGDTLDEYSINKIMLDGILGRLESEDNADFKPDDQYFKRLQEQSLIPLGSFGLGSTKQGLMKLRDFVNKNRVYSQHANLYQALKAGMKSANEPKSVRIECGNYIISGSLPVIEHSSRTFLLRFRYAGIKPKDRLRAWLEHLAGHASGLSFYTDIAGKMKDRGKVTIELASLEPLSKDDARKILKSILDLYELGQRTLVPFTPATSYAFAEAMAQGQDEETALGSAEDEWSGYNFPENSDKYFYAAWSDDGPMEYADFKKYARLFWDNYHISAAPGRTETVSSTEKPEESDE